MYKMIIVEDEAFIRVQLKSLFDWRSMGFIVMECFEDTATAAEYIENNYVDVLFTDIRLGKSTGLELAKHAREVKPEIEIVLISAFSEFEYAQDALRLSIFDYLEKPVTYTAVVECFTRLCKKLHAKTDRAQNLISHIQSCIKNMDSKNVYMLASLYSRSAGDDIDEAKRRLLKLQAAINPNSEGEITDKINQATSVNTLSELATFIAKEALMQGATHDLQQIEHIKLFVAKHYSTNMGLEDIAAHVHMNPSYLSRYFKKHTGERFVDYLSRVRVDKAKELLANPANKINNIYEMVGYNSRHHFYEVFKKFTGTTPTEYRNRLTPL